MNTEEKVQAARSAVQVLRDARAQKHAEYERCRVKTEVLRLEANDLAIALSEFEPEE